MSAVHEARDEIAALGEGRQTEGWTDVSMPFWTAFQRNRFTAYDRLIRPQTNTIRSYLSGGHYLAAWERACTIKQESDACTVFEEGLRNARAASDMSLGIYPIDASVATTRLFVAGEIR